MWKDPVSELPFNDQTIKQILICDSHVHLALCLSSKILQDVEPFRVIGARQYSSQTPVVLYGSAVGLCRAIWYFEKDAES
jgi:hypothetical protein